MLRLVRGAAPRHRDVTPTLEEYIPRMGLTSEELDHLDNLQATENTRDPRKMSNAHLAELHLGYGPGGDESIDDEFWGRFPALYAQYQTITYLDSCDPEPQDILGMLVPHPAPSATPVAREHLAPCIEALRQRYRASVQAVVDGIG